MAVKIPILRPNELPTKLYFVALKKAIKSDGCSKSPDIYGDCCIGHDLHYRFGIDLYGNPVKKKDSDNYLKGCMEKASVLKRWSLIAKVYWLGVKELGGWAYADDVDERSSFETYFWTT